MRKICLTLVGIYLLFVHAFSQSTTPVTDSAYKNRKLKIDEVHLVSSYYWQTGDHSAIEGGIGSEKVTDLANGLEVKVVGYDFKGRKNTVTAGMGMDIHTAASQAWVSKTGASKTSGTRYYPSLNWNRENEDKGTSFGFGAIYSTEYNYTSWGLDAEFSKKTHNNGEFNAKFSTYLDEVKMIRPSEFNVVDTDGTVRIAARKGDLLIDDGKDVVTLAQGQETTRDENNPDATQNTNKKKRNRKAVPGATPAAGGGALSSPIAIGVGAGAIIGVTTWVLLQHDNPASPSKP